MTTPSPEFARFLASLDEPIGRGNVDSFDRRALLSLAGAEKTAAEDRLIALLPRTTDARVARALVDLETVRAAPALRAALPLSREPIAKIAIASALKKLAGDPSGLQEVVSALHSAPTWSARSLAATALPLFPGRDAEDALLTALGDPERTVRMNAFDALLELRSLQSLTSSYLDALGMLKALLGSDLASIRNTALADIRQILDALRDGHTVTQLGLDYTAPEEADWNVRLTDSLSDDNPSIDMAALQATSGRDREWAESLLMTRLPDPRISRALGEIGSKRAVPALQEIASTSGLEAAAAVDALSNVRAPRG